MEIIHTDTNGFDKVLENKKVLVDFYADWCGPCRMLGPVLEEVSKVNDDVLIVKVNVDDAQEIAARYGVMSIPTMILFENSEIKDTKVGVLTQEQILDWIK